MNNSHHKIMEYQLETYLHLKLSYDELQLLSGRIDVLGNSVNLDEVYREKIKLWNISPRMTLWLLHMKNK